MNQLIEFFKIAETHAARLKHAMVELSHLFPTSPEKLKTLSERDFLLIELLTNRFSKLGDFIGTKLVGAFLESKGELIYNMTMIDKINKLEKLGLLKDAVLWSKMRELRNHLAHEYPEHPEITASLLNQTFEFAPSLLLLLENLKKACTSV